MRPALIASLGLGLVAAAVAVAASTGLGLDGLLAAVQAEQQRLYRGLARMVRTVRDDGAIGPVLALWGAAFLYGVLHAIGPGHGKAVIAAYLGSHAAQVTRALGVSLIGALVQGVMALAVVGVLHLALGLGSRSTLDGLRWVELAGYVVIGLYGGMLLIAALRGSTHAGRAHAHTHGDTCGHSHGHGHRHAHGSAGPDPSGDGRWTALAAGIVAGLRPCSGAVMLLVLAIGQGVALAGAAGVFVMALGTALTTAAVALAAQQGRTRLLGLLGDGSAARARWSRRLAALGGLALLVLGSSLTLAGIQSPPIPS